MYLKYFKRLIDLVISITAFITLIPLFIIISIILLLTGEYYIFFLQDRVGYKNSSFRIWKFATMLKNSKNMPGGSLTITNDPRVLPFGKFLRKTKINELPQIINVIKGDMSVVGPRPQMKVDFLKYSKDIQDQIYDSKPGITGLGSIIFRDEEKWITSCEGDRNEFYKKHIAPYKGELEIWYKNNISIWLDIIIIFLTAWAIFFSNSNFIYKIFKNLPEKPINFNK